MYCREIMHANIHALCVRYCGGINDSIGHSVMFTSFLRQDSTFFSLLCLQPGVSYYYVQDDILLVLTLQCTSIPSYILQAEVSF